MATRIKPEDWKPEGVAELEATALRVATGGKNILVVAGPGAGKTELLAQRASFLLVTGSCPFPKRILAISFKRDAAKNLKERVRLRCGPELVRRFDSMTFDAFSKSLLDRFRTAVPTKYRPVSDYEIDFTIQGKMTDHLITLLRPGVNFTMADIQGINTGQFYRRTFLGHSLVIQDVEPSSLEEEIAADLWQELVVRGGSSELDFPMVGRLAELILNANPLILSALRLTYSHLFLDEFQDTTSVQFAVTIAAFKGSTSVITAVGDDKQRIMAWAGAVPTIFEDFQREFRARKETLLLNHRSAPELVRIQNYFIQMLDPDAAAPRASRTNLEGECRVLVFDNHDDEARWISDFVEDLITNKNLTPRDLCILTRNRPEQYTTFIASALSQKGIKSRLETELQDIVAEPLSNLVSALLNIALADRAQQCWNEAIQVYFEINGVDEESGEAARYEAKLAAFLREMRDQIEPMPPETRAVQNLIKRLIRFIGEEQYRLAHSQYRQGTYFDDLIEKIAKLLCDYRNEEPNWLDAVKHYQGEDCVPIMTIHKSKGLEYNTVLFVGLEDSAMWSFRSAPEEEKRTFFVAFSRAIQRAVFTFCEVRERGDRGSEGQSRRNIGIFYDTLREAGIEEERINFED